MVADNLVSRPSATANGSVLGDFGIGHDPIGGPDDPGSGSAEASRLCIDRRVKARCI
jgi:hypothetical protein